MLQYSIKSIENLFKNNIVRVLVAIISIVHGRSNECVVYVKKVVFCLNLIGP